jgi:hypothetical protein
MTRTLLKPLDNLLFNIRLFFDGYWEQRSNFERDDEIGQLAEGFNSMADEIVNLYISVESYKKDVQEEIPIIPVPPPLPEPNMDISESKTTQEDSNSEDQYLQLASSFSTIKNCPGLFDSISNSISHFFNNVNFYVVLSKNSNEITIPYKSWSNSSIEEQPVLLGKNILSQVLTEGKTLLINQVSPDQFSNMEIYNGRQTPQSWVGIPLVTYGETIGAIVVEDMEQEHRFTHSHLAWLGILSSYIASAVKILRLLEQQSSSPNDHEYQNQPFISRINSCEEPEQILKVAKEELIEFLKTDEIDISIETSGKS